jgi:hypothetical protein
MVNALRDGNTRRAAAGAAGVCHDTLYQWLKEDADFADAVLKAEADAEVFHVKVITQQANAGCWTASAWWLERHPRTKADWRKTDERDVRILSDQELIAATTDAVTGDGSPRAEAPEFDD